MTLAHLKIKLPALLLLATSLLSAQQTPIVSNYDYQAAFETIGVCCADSQYAVNKNSTASFIFGKVIFY